MLVDVLTEIEMQLEVGTFDQKVFLRLDMEDLAQAVQKMFIFKHQGSGLALTPET
jgi:hypothetical protein